MNTEQTTNDEYRNLLCAGCLRIVEIRKGSECDFRERCHSCCDLMDKILRNKGTTQ